MQNKCIFCPRKPLVFCCCHACNNGQYLPDMIRCPRYQKTAYYRHYKQKRKIHFSKDVLGWLKSTIFGTKMIYLPHNLTSVLSYALCTASPRLDWWLKVFLFLLTAFRILKKKVVTFFSSKSISYKEIIWFFTFNQTWFLTCDISVVGK